MAASDPNIERAHGPDAWYQQSKSTARVVGAVDQWTQQVPSVSRSDGWPNQMDWRTCGYCGSMHPEDLLAHIRAGTVGHGEMADRKYGFPHKVYVDLPNPVAGQVVRYGSTTERDGRESFMEAPASATTTAKFYTRHMLGLSDALFAELATWIEEATGFLLSRVSETGERADDGFWWSRTKPQPIDPKVTAMIEGLRR